MTDTPEFGLTVEVPAEDWANTLRRLSFLEAVLTQVLRNETQIREWFTASEIARLKLPGLPTTPQGIGKRAAQKQWAFAYALRHGRKVTVYHYSALPTRAFAEFIRRIVALPDNGQLIPDPKPETIAPTPDAPQWLLPLMSLIENDRVDTWQEAYSMLRYTLPKRAPMPDREQVREVYRRYGK